MKKIIEILYPDGDPDHEWSANELEWIAEVVNRYVKERWEQ